MPKDLKNKSFANIQELFDKAMKRVNTFVDMDTDLVEGSEVRAEGSKTREESSSKRAGDELEQENAKKQKMDDDQEAAKRKELIKKSMMKRKADGSSRRYSAFIQMIRIFDREDLETLWKLVKAKHGYTRPEEAMRECYGGRIVRIKRLPDDLRVTAAKVLVTAAKHKLVLSHYKEPTELEIQEMVNILVSGEAYDKVFNHLHVPLEKKVLILTSTKSLLLLLAVFMLEVIPFIKTLWDLLKDFDNGLHSEINEVKIDFNQMEAAVEQYVMNIVMHANFVTVNVLPANNKYLVHDNLEIERLEQENDHLFELLLSQDIEIVKHAKALRPLDSDLESYNSNNLEPIQNWGSNVSTAPSSSLIYFRLSKFFSGTIRFGNDQIAKIMGYGKSKKHTYKPKAEDIIQEKLYLLHMDLCGPMRIQSINRKPDLSYLHVFGALCYPTNDSEDLGKLKPKAYIGIFVSYAPTNKAYIIYNKRTRLIIKTIHVTFDERTFMASEQFSSELGPQFLTPGTLSSGLVPNPPSPTPYVPPTKKERDTLFQLMFDEYFNPPPSVASPVLAVVAQEHVDSTGTPSSTLVDQDVPTPSTSQTPQETQSTVIPSGVEKEFHDIEVAHLDNDPFFGAPRAWYDLLSSFLLSQKFFKGTVDPTLLAQKEGKDILLDSCITLTAFADAYHAGCQDIKRSTSGNPSILTSDIILSRSKWKMGWLNYTLSKQNISWQISLPRHWDEKDLNFLSTSLE
ncbi:retrovirus-related pol polyprotein from transposon TNT 1-94 [Tanacetum coccineum]|uniref:Retrovirus-related pol polyprotein from transposon TNT 1-94 n=1 Tax=Tanacetum coccineum TaxID=301880 RepID=A0ABQ5J5V9_9ASTR